MVWPLWLQAFAWGVLGSALPVTLLVAWLQRDNRSTEKR